MENSNNPNYVIFVFSYNDKDEIIGDHFVSDHGDAKALALDAANQLVDDKVKLKEYAHPNAAYVSVEIETVVERDDWTVNENTIFSEFVRF